jgi:hypothetical protein
MSARAVSAGSPARSLNRLVRGVVAAELQEHDRSTPGERQLDVNLAHNGMLATQLERAIWRKSQRSNPSGNCVEIAFLNGDQIAMRNSRHPDGPALIFTRDDWDAFIGGAQDGDFGQPAS